MLRQADEGNAKIHGLQRQRGLSLPLATLLICTIVVLSHLTLLRLPYFWDEGGYYVPAALDFFNSGTLIPSYTNAHPPLPNVLLGTLWHLFGFHIVVTRITASVAAGIAVTAVYALGRKLLGPWPALTTAALTACYPIWFAQSSLAHADIFAAAFTLWGLALYLSSPNLIGTRPESFSSGKRFFATAFLFSASALSKETAIVQPLALGLLEIFLWLRTPRQQEVYRRTHRHWAFALLAPLPVLACWYLYHFLKTGFIFGNPEFLRYNATANLSRTHIVYAFWVRLVHLFWQRQIWVPLALALASFMLPARRDTTAGPGPAGLPRSLVRRIGLLVAANLLAFSVLGGALLTRYLLPIYPLLLLVYVAIWCSHTAHWPWLAAVTAAAFFSAIWWNPNAFFAPEDNLTYRDMIVVQQHAIAYLDQHYPGATVLTAWPVSAEITRPELGYTPHRFRVDPIEGFGPADLEKAAQDPERYDTAVIFTTHFVSPGFRRSLVQHPNSWRSRRYSADLDLLPPEVARRLGGTVVWQQDIGGEWAAVLRFPRSYEAALQAPTGTGQATRFPSRPSRALKPRRCHP